MGLVENHQTAQGQIVYLPLLLQAQRSGINSVWKHIHLSTCITLFQTTIFVRLVHREKRLLWKKHFDYVVMRAGGRRAGGRAGGLFPYVPISVFEECVYIFFVVFTTKRIHMLRDSPAFKHYLWLDFCAWKSKGTLPSIIIGGDDYLADRKFPTPPWAAPKIVEFDGLHLKSSDLTVCTCNRWIWQSAT